MSRQLQHSKMYSRLHASPDQSELLQHEGLPSDPIKLGPDAEVHATYGLPT